MEVKDSSLEARLSAVQRAATGGELLQAVRQLADCPHPEGAPQLVEVLGYNNPAAAVAAVEGLVSLGEAAVPALLALDPQNYGARAWAVRALAGIGDVRGLELLEDALGGDVAASVRRAAARGLGALRLAPLPPQQRLTLRRRCLAALTAACADGEWVVRYAVAMGLESLCRGLGEPLTEDDHALRRHALASLKTLAEAPQEPIVVVRSRARLALARLQKP